jgi:putative membrane protein
MPGLQIAPRVAAVAISSSLFLGGGQSFGQNSSQKIDSGSAKMLKSPDTAFVFKAAQGGAAEVKLGQLASENAVNAAVKAFAQHMVDDHNKANDDLKGIAEKENMTLPTDLNAKDQARYHKLSGESGIQFDHDYVRVMVKDHRQDVKAFQKEAKKGKNPQIKDFAARTLPVLQSHLDQIKSIHSKGGK